ncbi:MAG: NAD(+)/NADH kinase [Ardenticatenia bacterium]|nr:NAD(+)/NADH kinase [Ardenticatenia bacterium]
MTTIEHVGLLYHPYIPESRALAEELAAIFHRAGVHTWLESSRDHESLQPRAGNSDLLVTLGGDGTILRAARAALPKSPPILAVNFGHLGFMTELSPDEALGALPNVLAGHFWVEERPLLDVTVVRNGRDKAHLVAVNDVVLARGDGPHALKLDMWVDGARVTRYVADGLIIATPTGSTAYALAAGGPVIAPTVNALIVVPVAAHLAHLRNLVVPAHATVEVTTLTPYHETVAVVDGQSRCALGTRRPAARHREPPRRAFRAAGLPQLLL